MLCCSQNVFSISCPFLLSLGFSNEIGDISNALHVCHPVAISWETTQRASGTRILGIICLYLTSDFHNFLVMLLFSFLNFSLNTHNEAFLRSLISKCPFSSNHTQQSCSGAPHLDKTWALPSSQCVSLSLSSTHCSISCPLTDCRVNFGVQGLSLTSSALCQAADGLQPSCSARVSSADAWG